MTTVGAIAVAGAAIVALYAMQNTQPGYGDITGPLVVARGGPKEALAARDFQVEVTGYKAARRLKTVQYGKPGLLTTGGVWVLVAVKARALARTVTLTSASWEGPSRARYHASERLPSSLGMLSSARLDPGLEREALLAFEIPESELAGGTLRIAQTPYTPMRGEIVVGMPPFTGDRIVEELDLGS